MEAAERDGMGVRSFVYGGHRWPNLVFCIIVNLSYGKGNPCSRFDNLPTLGGDGVASRVCLFTGTAKGAKLRRVQKCSKPNKRVCASNLS
jgi:hypothetical protein